MININDELTYYKSKDFVNYMLGCFKHSDEHFTFENMEALSVSVWGIEKFNINYENPGERQSVSEMIYRVIKEDEGAFNMFRCDFDFGIDIFNNETYEEDYKDILGIFYNYCNDYDTYGFITTHFDQMKEDNDLLALSRHMHLVYKEPVDAPSFTDYLHTKIM